MLSGLLGIIVLVIDIWALYNIWTSAAGAGSKVIWTLVILFLPILGAIVWFFVGPKSASA